MKTADRIRLSLTGPAPTEGPSPAPAAITHSARHATDGRRTAKLLLTVGVLGTCAAGQLVAIRTCTR
jgi:hypothetical protein